MMTEERFTEFKKEITNFKNLYEKLTVNDRLGFHARIRKMLISGQKTVYSSIRFPQEKEINEWWINLDSDMRCTFGSWWSYTAPWTDNVFQNPTRTIDFEKLADDNNGLMKLIRFTNK